MDHKTRPALRQLGAAGLALAVTALLFAVYFALYHIYPLGSRSIVWCDMEQQAVPLLLHFKELVLRGESIAYSVLDAGGMQFYGVFFFFLSNPFSLLVLVSDIPADMLVTVMVAAKLALASGTAALWLCRRVPELPLPHHVLLAVMYGCSGYGLFYYQNLMWLDIMVMLPVLMITLDILLRDADAKPYFLALSVMMLLCFYLCYMIVLFLLIYTALSIRYLVPEERRGVTARRLLGASIAAAFATAAIWLPCFLQVMASARSGSIVGRLMDSYIVNHLDDKLALLGCTAICFAVVPRLWKIEKKPAPLSLRDRTLCVLLMLALLLDPINMMWHTGSYQAFPLRWGMIPILLLLTLAARMLADRSLPPFRGGKACGILLLCSGILLCGGSALLLMQKAKDQLLDYVSTLWVEPAGFFLRLIPILLAALTYALCIRLFRGRQIGRAFSSAALCLLFLCEFTFSFFCYMGKAGDEDLLFRQTISAADKISDEDFYRVRMTKKYAHANMVGALGYPTIAHYTSMTREDFMHGIKRCGYSSYWMEVTGTGGTVLTDALWNIRYLLGQSPDFPGWTERIWDDGLLAIARSRLTMPGAVTVGAKPADIAALPDGNRAAVQAYLAHQMLGERELVQEYPVTEVLEASLTRGTPQKLTLTDPDGSTHSETFSGSALCTLQDAAQTGEIRFAFFVKGRQALYFDLYSQTGINLSNPRNSAVRVMRDGRTVNASYPDNSNNGIVFLGEAENEYVSVHITVNHDFSCESLCVFGMDLDRLEAAMQQTPGAEMSYRRGTYTASLQTDRPQTLIFAVPYDASFTAEVNGQPVPVFCVNDCETAVEIPAGESTVTLRFHVCGLGAALCLSAVGLLLCAAAMLLWKYVPKRVQAATERLSVLAVQAAYGVILLAVYLLPVILCLIGGIRTLMS